MKNLQKCVAALAVTLSLVIFVQRVHAIDTVLNYDGSQIAAARADGPYTVGQLIRVGVVDQTVTHLGAQDADAAVNAQDPDGADGLTGFADDDGFFIDTFGNGSGIQVGLWTGDGSTLLASVLVTSSDQEIGSWRYAPIPGGPVTLQADQDYLIGAFVGGGIEWFLDGNTTQTTPFSASPEFTLIETRFLFGSFGAPVSNGGGSLGRWGPANAANLIPEPATASLMILGGSLLLVRRRRQMA